MGNKNHLIFLGFINAGKSLFGERVATDYKCGYINLGALFAQHFGRERSVSPADFAKEHPAKYLSEQESWVSDNIVWLASQPPAVVNLPGSMIQKGPAMERLRDFCLTIYLACNFETLEQRLPFAKKGEKALLVGARTYRELYGLRVTLYERHADYKIEETVNPEIDYQMVRSAIDREGIFQK
jgi:shikimate kinase